MRWASVLAVDNDDASADHALAMWDEEEAALKASVETESPAVVSAAVELVNKPAEPVHAGVEQQAASAEDSQPAVMAAATTENVPPKQKKKKITAEEGEGPVKKKQKKDGAELGMRREAPDGGIRAAAEGGGKEKRKKPEGAACAAATTAVMKEPTSAVGAGLGDQRAAGCYAPIAMMVRIANMERFSVEYTISSGDTFNVHNGRVIVPDHMKVRLLSFAQSNDPFTLPFDILVHVKY